MSVRAGIVVTGTEVLSGIIRDENGPWLSERLRELGVKLAHMMVVGDRPRRPARRARLPAARADGPRDHDRRARADRRRPHRRGGGGVRRRSRSSSTRRSRSGSGRSSRGCGGRWRDVEEASCARATASRRSCRAGAIVLEPVGTAPGLVVAGRRRPSVVVLPGPPRELQPMWAMALETAPVRALLSRAGALEQRIMRMFGLPESEIARTLRDVAASGVALDRLEITTCLRRGEIEIATVFPPSAARRVRAFEAAVLERHGDRGVLARRVDDRRARRGAAPRAAGDDGGDGRVVHRRADGGAADRPRRARRRTCWAAWSCTPTRPRWRWRACRPR